MSKSYHAIGLVSVILIFCSGYLGGCSSERRTGTSISEMLNDQAPAAMIIKSREDRPSVQTSSQLSKAFEYTRIPFASHDLSLASQKLDIPETIKLLYLTTTRQEAISDSLVSSLLSFVASGGRLIITQPPFDDRLAFLAGINPAKGYTLNRNAEGFIFRNNFFPGGPDSSIKTPSTYFHQGLDGGNFKPVARELATASNDTTYPVITSRKLGNGTVILFNTFLGPEKDYRGLLFSAGLPGLNGIPYRVANTSTIFLDDFPAPLYKEKFPPIDEEYDMTHAEFVTRVWWPDMKALADTLELDYTAALCFNYNANIVPPFDFDEWLSGEMQIKGTLQTGNIWLAEQVQNSRHELGFHGYNHFSLWRQDWPNLEFMISSVQAARKRWTIDGLGSFPVTYVPPTNHVDSLGLVAISKGMPTIEYMSSLYLGDFQTGEGREFGPEPVVPGYFDYPRISSGFTPTPSSRFNMHSLYLITGIWTHFVHPDDVFEINRPEGDPFQSRNPLGLGWHGGPERDYGLYEVFREWIRENKKIYPLLRFTTASEAVPIVRKWLDQRSNYRFSNDTLLTVINGPTSADENYYWFMYADDKNLTGVAHTLEKQGIEISTADIWQGKLVQFSSASDSLYLPNPIDTSSGKPEIEKIVAEVMESYRMEVEGIQDELRPEERQAMEDRRLREAIAKLEDNPDSLKLQEEVIHLAVENDRVTVAIPILEKRLLTRGSERGNAKETSYYTVQIGAFSTREAAHKFADTSEQKLGLPFSVSYAAPVNLFRVYLDVSPQKGTLKFANEKLKEIKKLTGYKRAFLVYRTETVRGEEAGESKGWDSNDVDRLLTFYGYQNASKRAFGFLEKLWQKYHDRRVIKLKDMMVRRYGLPDESFRQKWLKRELELDPDNEKLLSKLVYTNQSPGEWPKVKSWLNRLIALNPDSDSLYHYTLQRSFYYDSPEKTLDLLQSFPQSAESQLEPLASQIANVYAYIGENFKKALEWANKVEDFPIRTRLYWMQKVGRFEDFRETGTGYVNKHPKDDTTRVFVGQELMYSGNYEEGFRVLYPLFKNNKAPKPTKNLVHTEIGYMGFEQQKEFYREYPSFFPDSLYQDLQQRYRLNEGVEIKLNGSYASDNFGNELAGAGSVIEWGNRQKYIHSVKVDELFAGSDIGGVSLSDRLHHLNYRYRHKNDSQSMQSTVGGGLYYADGDVFPDAEVGFWFAKDSAFTSLSITLQPEVTNSALNRHINRYRATVYREDYWMKGKLMSSLSGVGNYYSDNVYAYESLGRAYIALPFSTSLVRFRTIGELSYSDATANNPGALPYYTPNNLLIKGAGIDFRYREAAQNPTLSADFEVMGKHENRDGLYWSATARFNARLNTFWEVSLDAHFSSSSVYRYNNFGFSLRYLLPKKLGGHDRNNK